jgi:RNA polymerase sigma-70 factor (ECF subfamily)
VSSDETAEAIAEADERDRVRATLATLPERQALALLLRHGGYSYREIASALGVAEGSVGVLLARGERAFRQAHEEMNR